LNEERQQTLTAKAEIFPTIRYELDDMNGNDNQNRSNEIGTFLLICTGGVCCCKDQHFSSTRTAIQSIKQINQTNQSNKSIKQINQTNQSNKSIKQINQTNQSNKSINQINQIQSL